MLWIRIVSERPENTRVFLKKIYPGQRHHHFTGEKPYEKYKMHEFILSRTVLRYMLEEFCEGNHCDQYIHPVGGSFAQCLMVQRELSRVNACPLRYERIVAKAITEERAIPHNEVKGGPPGKKGFSVRSK
jgi:hypothetical protein